MVVMPSSFETFGTVALESLSRGRIVIIGEDHGIREFEILNKCLFNFYDFLIGRKKQFNFLID